MSRFSDFIDSIEVELNDSSVKFVKNLPDRKGQHGQRRRIHFYKTGGSIEKASQAGGRIVDGTSREPAVYFRHETIEAVVFAEDDDSLDTLVDNLLVAIDRVSPNGGVLFNDYDFNYDQYSKRIPITTLNFNVKLPVIDEIKPLTIILDEEHFCRFDTLNENIQNMTDYVLTGDGYELGETFKPESMEIFGSRVWALSATDNTIYEYQMEGTDVSTMVETGVSFQCYGSSDSFRWHDNGNVLFTTSSYPINITYQYECSIPYDLDTAVETDSYNFTDDITNNIPEAVSGRINSRSIDITGNILTVVNITNHVLQYSFVDNISDIELITVTDLEDVTGQDVDVEEMRWVNENQFIMSCGSGIVNRMLVLVNIPTSNYIIKQAVADPTPLNIAGASPRSFVVNGGLLNIADKNNSTIWIGKHTI